MYQNIRKKAEVSSIAHNAIKSIYLKTKGKQLKCAIVIELFFLVQCPSNLPAPSFLVQVSIRSYIIIELGVP
jgi:hypothetical protein